MVPVNPITCEENIDGINIGIDTFSDNERRYRTDWNLGNFRK